MNLIDIAYTIASGLIVTVAILGALTYRMSLQLQREQDRAIEHREAIERGDEEP